MYNFVFSVLATFGSAALIVRYDGPFNIFVRVRSAFHVAHCVVCLSVWLAIPITLVEGLSFIEYLAVLGVLVVLERLT